MEESKEMNLEEARKLGLLKRFAKEHTSKGDRDLFERLLEAMAKPKNSPEGDQT
jgi:hypothetical protein